MKTSSSLLRRQICRQATFTTTFGLLLASPSAFSAIISLTPGDINGGDTSRTSFTDANVVMTPLIGSTPSTFNGNAVRLGNDDNGTNVNAFNDPDTNPNNGNEEKLQMDFEPNAGLSSISWDFSRADGATAQDGLFISGFSADPVASASGAGAPVVTYNISTGTVNVKVPYEGSGADTILTFANPAASAGQTLLLTVNDTDQVGAQLAITGISYEDAVATSPPVISQGLPAQTDTFEGVDASLAVTLQPGAFPVPTYLWEVDNGSGFVTAPGDSASPAYTFTGGTATDGTYRVTITGAGTPVTSQTLVVSTDDSDNLPNQWEVDNFGDISQGDADDPDADNFSNLEEFNATTDPNDPDTDNDALNDGDEAPNNADPLLFDTDSDGFADGYEVANGTAADDIDDAPLTASGRNSIGVTFSAPNGQAPGINLTPAMVAGAPGYEQKNWNILPAATGIVLEEDVTAPLPGVLADSTGTEVAQMLFTSTAAGSFSLLFNQEQTIGGLLSGYLFASAANPTMSIAFEEIPYSRYDIVVYPITFSGQNGRVIVGEVEATPISEVNEYTMSTPRVYQAGEDPTWYRSADRSNFADGSSENFPEATHLIFRGLQGANATIELFRVVDNGGIAAIQVVEAPDSDGDGMGDAYEIEVGLNPNDNGATDAVKEGANGDFDGDGLSNIDEHNNGTDPTEADSDCDGYGDAIESDTGTFADLATDTGTDPRIADTDGDGFPDGIETNTGIFVDANDIGTDPLVAQAGGDLDGDGYSDVYEDENNTLETPFDPFDPEIPGGPNPNGFAIAFNSIAGFTTGPDVEFGANVYAGVPEVAQKNWNRTSDLTNSPAGASGGIALIGSPQVGQLVDSSGNVISGAPSGVDINFTAGGGSFSFFANTSTPYEKLYNSFIFGSSVLGNLDSQVELTNIPYAAYDAYVYMGSETNTRTGTVSSLSASASFPFITGASPIATGLGPVFVEATSEGIQANVAVFRNQTSSAFDVTATVGANQNSLGIFGVQIVEVEAGALLTLENPARVGATFTADFTTNTAGNYQLERSLTLNDDWAPVGAVFSASVGTTPVTDPAAPAGRAFYRVSAQ